MIFYCCVTLAVLALGWFVNTSYRNKMNIEGSVSPGQIKISRQEFLNRILLFAIFAVLFLVAALRIGTGSDYWVYRSNFLLIAGGDTPVSYEIGFKGLVLLVQHLFGKDAFLVIFGIMAFFTAVFFVKGIYDSAEWFFFSLFLFMANGFYFMSFSNVRYYFVFGIVLCSIKPFMNKQYARFILWILIAALFHKTVLIVVPVFFAAYYLKWSKKTIWLIPAAVLGLIAGKRIIRFLLFKIYPFYEGDLRFDNSEISYVNIAKCAAILVLALLFYKKAVAGKKMAEFCFNLNLFALVLYSFGYYIPELTRICYYMVIGQIFLVPAVLRVIDKKWLRILFISGVSAAYGVYFLVFLRNGYTAGIGILPYLTWLFD